MSPLLLIVYAAVALAAGLLLTDGGRGWRLRGAVIVAAPLLAFALWQATQPPRGWPTTATLPKTAGFLWGAIREPDPLTGDPGRIFVWVDVGADRPRAFSLPYSRQLHRRLQQAMNATKHGHSVMVSRRQRGRGQRGGRIRFYKHPAVSLPSKGEG